MSLIRTLALVVVGFGFGLGCQSKPVPRATPAPATAAAPAAGSAGSPTPARVATTAAAPKLPPPPLAARAKLVVTAPTVARVAPNCANVKLRVYADGVRRSCMTASPERADSHAQMVVSCGTRAELPAEQPLHLELRYEQRGRELARIDLGDARTLDRGDQMLAAAGAIVYAGDRDHLCP